MQRVLRAMMLAFLFVGATGCTATTESTEVGVRVAKVPFLSGRGVVDEVYPQGGTYFFFRPLSDWYVFDVAIQNLVMVREKAEGDRRGDDSLRFKTIDGNDVSVNVTVAWSIEPTKAPHLLQHVGNSTAEVEEKLVRPVSRAVIRDVLNELTSEAYYQAQERFKLASKAQEILNAKLLPEGVSISQVLLGEHQFNPDYEKAIREKKVFEQEAEQLTSEAEAAAEEQKRDLEQAKGRVNQFLEEARGRAEKRKLEADAIFFEREKQAEAILAEATARAEGLTEKAKALSGSGGERMVKLAIAKKLKGKRILFIPAGDGGDLRTMDMNGLIQTVGAVRALDKAEGSQEVE